jgi:hypothetical protein
MIGSDLQIISLCEVAMVSEGGTTINIQRNTGENVQCTEFLKDHQWAHTQTMEPTSVRFLMVQGNFGVDVRSSPPQKIPTLKDIVDQLTKTVSGAAIGRRPISETERSLSQTGSLSIAPIHVRFAQYHQSFVNRDCCANLLVKQGCKNGTYELGVRHL